MWVAIVALVVLGGLALAGILTGSLDPMTAIGSLGGTFLGWLGLQRPQDRKAVAPTKVMAPR